MLIEKACQQREKPQHKNTGFWRNETEPLFIAPGGESSFLIHWAFSFKTLTCRTCSTSVVPSSVERVTFLFYFFQSVK
jgi:hypothetical protein